MTAIVKILAQARRSDSSMREGVEVIDFSFCVVRDASLTKIFHCGLNNVAVWCIFVYMKQSILRVGGALEFCSA